ncbi:MAG: hypothetical protein GX882_03290 [Methanomicrobiales archaeon]|nr:hypothetical protein [Methanomicrobiales archaeon]
MISERTIFKAVVTAVLLMVLIATPVVAERAITDDDMNVFVDEESFIPGSGDDDVEIKSEAGGSVTIVTSGTGTYYIGDEITFSGTCTDGDTVYLFMTGPNLALNGVNLTRLWPVITENNGTFTTVSVDSDDTWLYKWNTAGLPFDAGSYTFYAVSEPRGKDDLSGARYATTLVNLRNGYVTASVSSTAVTRGDRLTISGIATGSPDNVFVWIFGKNYYGAPGELSVRSASVESDGSFEVELDSSDTEDLAGGQYFVVVQHPMGSIAGNAGSITVNTATGTIAAPDFFGVKLTGLQAPAAATALINALDSPNIPDTYVKLTFFVETLRIWIDGISDQTYGETFTVTGTTDYPADTALTYRLSANEDGADVLSGEVIVGDNGDWSFEVDTTTIGPGAYTLLVESQDGQASTVTLFDVYDDIIHPVPPGGATYLVERISINPVLDDLSPGDEVTLDGSICFRGPLLWHSKYFVDGYLEFSTDLQDPVWTYALQVGGQWDSTSSTTVSSRSFMLSAWELVYRDDEVYILITLSGTVPRVEKDDPALLRIIEREASGKVVPNSEHRLLFTPAGSNQSPIFGKNLTLHPGWNFISIPRHLEAGNDTASIFTPIDTAGHSALRYDTAGRAWVSLTPTDRLTPLEGIWIYSENLTTIPLTFSIDLPLPPSERSLAQGWNAIGITGASSASARDTLLSVNRGWTTLIGFDAGEQDFEVAIINGGSDGYTDSRPVYPGRGYWLYMTEPGDLCAIGV